MTWCCRELGVEFSHITEHAPLNYNPNDQVPVVKIEEEGKDPFTLYESFAINNYLCKRFQSKMAAKSPEEEAKIATDVLLEADKRGISSHGIGRLKPIYCDRIDAGIMTPTAPFTVVRDAGAMALVDGNMGLGLTVGPRCMEMAIKKAKSLLE